MPHYQFLIIGGGMTAASAVKGIRKNAPGTSIGIVSGEPNPPYDRPPLTKGLWKGKPLEKIWRLVEDENIEIHLSKQIVRLDPARKLAVDSDNNEFTYDQLLLATGGTPRRLPFGGDDIIYYRTLEDYKTLRNLTSQGNHFAVVGGGFIGSELAAALSMNGCDTSIIFPEDGLCARVFPADLSRFVTDYYREKGVKVYGGETISTIESRMNRKLITTKSGKEIWVDTIIAGIGIRPETDLAASAGIKIADGPAGGILVDEYLQTKVPEIYAAGDVANFFNPALGQRMRVEHEDNANTMGEFAGRNMSGEPVRYDHLPYFYSDLFDLGYEAVGLLNSDLEIYADWQEKYKKGVLYYLKDKRVRGVLLWNVWDQVPEARKLIAEPGPFSAEQLKGRLPR